MRSLLATTLPAVVIAAVWLYAHEIVLFLPNWAIQYGPYSAIGLTMVFAFGFNHSRAFFSVTVLALAYWVLTSYSPQPSHNTLIYALSSILVPINLLFFYLTRERGILTTHGALRFLFIGTQLLAAFWLSYYPSFELFAWLTQQFARSPGWLHLQVPQAAAAASFFSITLIILHFIVDRGSLDEGFLGAVAALFIGYNWIMVPGIFPLFVTLGAVLMLVSVIQESYRMAYRDELTGLPSRRAFNDRMASLGRRYAIAMVDVDHFKKFNDTYGHDIGDQVLRVVATKLRGVSGGGKAFRYGGEEFSLVFPGAGVNDAAPHLEALLRNIADYKIVLRGKNRPSKERRKKKRTDKQKDKPVSVTVSIGLAERDQKLRSTEAVLKAADEALYRAKRAGRNRLHS